MSRGLESSRVQASGAHPLGVPGSGVRPDGGLLAVHAHPDDETLATGGLLATWAAAGLPVAVVTCTRGERGEVIDTGLHPTGLRRLEGDGPALAAHRERELAAALGALGVGDHVFLDAADGVSGLRAAAARFVDSGMRWVAPGIAGPDPDPVLAGPGRAFATVPLDEAAGRLATLVRARRPRVVATYEPGGGYGHPDHVRAHDVTVRALALAEDPRADGVAGEPWHVPELWAPVRPEQDVRAARRALAAAPDVRALLSVGSSTPATAVAAATAPATAPAPATSVTLTLPDPDEPVLPPVATWWSAGAAAAAGARPALVDVPLARVADRLLAALRAHATQVQAVALDAREGAPDGARGEAREATRAAPDDAGARVVGRYALSNDVLAPLHAVERYAVLERRAGASSASAGTVAR